MIEGTRQKKFSKLVQKELSHILQFEISFPLQVMTTISVVRSTQDLSLSRIYVMVFPPQHRRQIVEFLNAERFNVRRLLGIRIRHQVRVVPELEFFEDDTLDYAEKMDEVFRKLERDDSTGKQDEVNT